MLNELAIITMVENPFNVKSRYTNYNYFKKGMDLVRLYTAEIMHSDGIYHVACNDDLRLTSSSVMWHQRNAYNLLINRLPSHIKYIAWIDADVLFTRQYWMYDIVKMLQQYAWIQLFSHAQNLGPSFQPIGDARPGYIYQYKTFGEIRGGVNFAPAEGKIPDHKNAHPGLAWAARRDVLSNVGMLIDWTIIGGADFHMLGGIFGTIGKLTKDKGFHANYVQMCYNWQERAKKYIGKDIGYVPGLILHMYHGDIKNRQYATREDILISHNFDPLKDIVKDHQGLYKFTDSNPPLEEAVLMYMRSRDDDQKGIILQG
jgi:hypothetical protein